MRDTVLAHEAVYLDDQCRGVGGASIVERIRDRLQSVEVSQ